MYEHFKKVLDADEWAFSEILNNIKLQDVSSSAEARVMAHHIIMGYDVWYRRVFNEDLAGLKFWSDIQIPQLAVYAYETYNKWRNALINEDITDFGQLIEYKDLHGNTHQSSIDEILIHITSHSAYHRGQIQSLMKNQGIAPVKNDLIVYFRNQNKD